MGATKTSLGVGSVVADTYVLERLLGEGGMGAVYLAKHIRLPGKLVAVKVLHAHTDHESFARFRREAEIASRLGHPNIVGVSDFNTLADGTPFLILEYLQGESLSKRIGNGPMGLAEARSILAQIAGGLGAAHAQGVVHRDLKPDNIILVPVEMGDVRFEQVKILDFGISKIRGSSTVHTMDSTVLGTPLYMSPEQALGENSTSDARTDIYALGVIAYEMLAGVPPFIGDSPIRLMYQVIHDTPPSLSKHRQDLPAHIVDAVHKALAKKQEDRFASTREFVEAFSDRAQAKGVVELGTRDTLDARVGLQDTVAGGMPVPRVTPKIVESSVSGASQTLNENARRDSLRSPKTRATLGPFVMAAVFLAGVITTVVAPSLYRRTNASLQTEPTASAHQEQPRHQEEQVGAFSPPISPNTQAASTFSVAEPTVSLVASASPHVLGVAPKRGQRTTVSSTAHAIPTAPPASSRSEAELAAAASEMGDRIVGAETAFAKGDLARAGELASALKFGGEPGRSYGYAIHGILACRRKDAEMAKSMFRHLQLPHLQKRVQKECKDVVVLE